MRTRAYVGGQVVPLHNITNYKSVIFEVELEDGRTVQLNVSDDGRVYLRGWGNIPAKLGNWDSMTFSGILAYEEQTTCEICYNQLTNCLCQISHALTK